MIVAIVSRARLSTILPAILMELFGRATKAEVLMVALIIRVVAIVEVLVLDIQLRPLVLNLTEEARQRGALLTESPRLGPSFSDPTKPQTSTSPTKPKQSEPTDSSRSTTSAACIQEKLPKRNPHIQSKRSGFLTGLLSWMLSILDSSSSH